MKYDIIIDDYIGWPCSYSRIKDQLSKLPKDAEVSVLISSLGGSLIDGLKIRQLFADHGNVTAYLHGMVASAATIIATGAKKIIMGKNSLYLMHRCSNWVESWGMMNAEELAAAIARLEKSKADLETIDRAVAGLYAARCKKPLSEVAGWMQQADFIDADECKRRNLVDAVCDDSAQRYTGAQASLMTMAACANKAPGKLTKAVAGGTKEAAAGTKEPAAASEPEAAPSTSANPFRAMGKLLADLLQGFGAHAEEEPASAGSAESAENPDNPENPENPDNPANPANPANQANQANPDDPETLKSTIADLRRQVAALSKADGATSDPATDPQDADDIDFQALQKAARRYL